MNYDDVDKYSLRTALINVYEEKTGVGNISLIYFEALEKILGDKNVNFYQIYEKNNVVSPTPKSKELLKVSGFPRWFRVPLIRLLILPKKCKNLDEKYLFLADPTLSFHIKRSPKKRIVIVHDLRPYTKFEKMFSEKLFFSFIRFSLKSCDAFLCDSYFTKKELCKLGVDSKKIEVIYPFIISQNYSIHIEASLKNIEKRQVTLTYIANDLPYKNIEFFLLLAKQINRMNKLDMDFHFILVSRNLSKKNLSFLEKNRIRNFKHFEHVENIKEVYDSTDILLHTSQYEGLGLPVMEAMSFGIPVIANNIEIMKEIIYDAGILCPQNSLESWLKGIATLLDRDNYEKFAKLSIFRVNNFTKPIFEKSLGDFLRKNILCSKS